MPRKNNKYHLNNANLHAAPLIQIQNHSQFKYVFKKGMDANCIWIHAYLFLFQCHQHMSWLSFQSLQWARCQQSLNKIFSFTTSVIIVASFLFCKWTYILLERPAPLFQKSKTRVGCCPLRRRFGGKCWSLHPLWLFRLNLRWWRCSLDISYASRMTAWLLY